MHKEEVTCNACGTIVFDKAIFCYQCGNQVKCKNCQEVLVAGARHCIACGVPVQDNQELTPKTFNKIKFKENGEERLYEIEFTNEVGQEIKEVVADLLKNKLGASPEPKLSFTENKIASSLSVAPQVNSVALSQRSEPVEAALRTENPKPKENITVIPEYPHLNDLEVKLDCRENEWLLIYAFYSSGFGSGTFTKDVVWKQYKEKRLTETRFKNLGTNWKSLFKKHICTVKENEFKFTAQGLDKANELLLMATNGSKFPSRSPRKSVIFAQANLNSQRTNPVSRKTAANTIEADEFDVYKNEHKISLEEFFARKKPGTGNPNRIVTIAYYITKINHQEYFTEGNIDFAYRILNLSGKPVHLKQVIINLKNSRIWFQKVLDRGTNGWRLTRQAEIYVEEKLPASRF
ncbi:zinc ribbon domain-containing protein [Adhaeribacter rhizoryzae]|uniref:Zinc ribbon domain-containing protein n=1 Tax=Adhaeribacter rhizoryzae TaxID=2607907 RepID=A0A5M6DND9_9BACT|nr:zinc ribbon domain-containing protein [Adhaeribacter rhizoryzae]KAA5547762.1 zinc ribbon domain-containing protein [Adhaeribacter rhizoryzae]